MDFSYRQKNEPSRRNSRQFRPYGLAFSSSLLLAALSASGHAQQMTLDPIEGVSLQPPLVITAADSARQEALKNAANQSLQIPILGGPLPVPSSQNTVEANGAVSSPKGVSPVPLADDGYEPSPVRAGVFNIRGQIDFLQGFSSNAEQIDGGKEGHFSQVNLDATAVSDWSRHELELGVNSTLDVQRSQGSKNQNLGLDARLRLDLHESMQANLAASYQVDREDVTALGAGFGVGNEPLVHNFGVDASISRNAGSIGVELGAGLSATRYGDFKTGGSTVSQKARGRNEALLRAALSYDAGSQFTPFVEAQYDYGGRVTELDANGVNRQFHGFRGSVGARFDNSDKLTGSVSLGYGLRNFKDASLDDLAGFVANAELNWSPTRHLDIGASGLIDFSTQEVAGVSGATRMRGEVTADWSLRDNWDLGASASIEHLAYSNDAHDTRYIAGISSNYWFNRYLGATAAARHIKQTSDRASASFSASEIEVGVSLRH